MNILRAMDTQVPTGNQFTNTTTETAFTSVVPLPANADSAANQGKGFQVKIFGYVSSAGSSPGTLTIRIKIGSTTIGTATFTLPVSLNASGFMIDAIAIFCTTGTSGKVACQGFGIIDGLGTAVPAGIVNAGTVAAGQVTVNTQTGQNLNFTGQFSVASASNICTLSQAVIEEIA